MLGLVDAAAFPDEPVTSPPRESRLGALVRHPQLSAALLALLIGLASVFSAVIAWRASLASIDSSRYQSLAVQQQARREQIERELEGIVEQDQRFVAEFQEDALAARELQAQADSIRATDPDAADILDLEAQSRLAMARATKHQVGQWSRWRSAGITVKTVSGRSLARMLRMSCTTAEPQ